MRKPPALKTTYARLFVDDLEFLRKAALERGTNFQVELRSLVRQAIKAQRNAKSGVVIR